MATQGKHNITGETFDPFVTNQIKFRQQIYGSPNRTIPQQQFLNNDGGFIRLVSSVDVSGGTMEEYGEFSRYTGNQLARNFILQGGVIKNGELPYGVTGVDIGGGFVTSNPAYGLGTSADNPYGFSPMPHLVDADIKSLNRGSLREANLNIVAYNPIQLNIIDALYLRLGYTVLLEWGHIILPDGNTNTFTLKEKILNGGIKGNAIAEVLKLTRDLRKASNGNYDAFFGKIKNYSWSFENDGSYKISLSIVSMGDVVESISVSSRYGKMPGLGPLTLTDDQKKGIKESAAKKKKEENIKKADEGEAIESDSEENVDQLIYAESAQSDINQYLYRCITFDVKTDETEDDDVIAEGISLESIQGNSTIIDLTDKVPGPKSANGGKNIVGISFDGCANQDQYFIRLGWLLELIEKYCLIYQQKEGSSDNPILNISYDVEENFCLTHKMQISADPRVCIIGNKDVEGLGILYPDNADSYYSTSPVEHGKLMNIYVSFVKVVSLLKEKRNEDGSVSLLDFLQTLMDDVATAIGGINTFEVIVDEDTNTVKILDNAKIPGIEKVLTENPPATFEIYGYKPNNSSFVKSISLKTEITNNLATEITVGAQANGVVDGAVDASAPSLLNKGFEDRIIPVKVAPGGNTTSKDEAFTEAQKKFQEDKKIYDAYIESQLTSEITGFFAPLYNFFADDDSNWDPELFDSCVSIQSNILKSDFIAMAKDGKASSTSGFIPLNLGLTFMGLSGMRIYEKFKINQNFLPRNYTKNIDFIIKGISHKIDKDGWYTSIESLSIPNNANSITQTESNPKLKTEKAQRIQSPPKPPTPPAGDINGTNSAYGGSAEFPNNAPSANAYAGGGGSFNANNQTLSAADQKNPDSQSRTITSNIAYTPAMKGAIKVRPGGKVKRIFLHHTAGNDNRVATVNSFNATKLACEFVLGRNIPDRSGKKYSSLLEQIFDYRYFRGICNSSIGADQEIGIEIASLGGGYKWRTVGGKRQLKMEGHGSEIWVDESDTEPIVDINLKPVIYLQYSHAQLINANMIKELEALLTSLLTTYNISFQFETEEDYQRVFPQKTGEYKNTIKTIVGICSHRMTHTGGKFDVMPTANIVAMLKRLGQKFKNGAPAGSGNQANPQAKVSIPAQFANANVGFRQGVAKAPNQVPQVITAAFAVTLLKKYKDNCEIRVNKQTQLKIEDPLNTDYIKGKFLTYKPSEVIKLDSEDNEIFIAVLPSGRVQFPLDISGTTRTAIVSINPADIQSIIPT